MRGSGVGIGAALAASALALGAGATSASAGAGCRLDGGGDQSEWTATITARVKVTCGGAKTVLRTCDRKGELPKGWTVSIKGGTVKLRKRSAGQSFKVVLAGGAPSCIGASGEG